MRPKIRLASAVKLVAGVSLAGALPVHAQTIPGTVIQNIASARWTVNDAVEGARSNADRLTIAERLDVVLAPGPQAPAGSPIAFVVRNAGSGTEAFDVTATAGQTALTIARDADGDGRFDPARDPVVEAGRTGALAPGEAVTLLALVRDAAPGPSVAITAQAVTGSGAPATPFPGHGDNGSDAVVGPTGAAARLDLPMVAASDQPTLVKSQTVRGPNGSSQPVSGATITYRLSTRLAGGEQDTAISDPIPAGTRYVAGSLTLDGAALSDDADADAGTADATRIRVRLGTPPAGTPITHTVQFTVKIL